MRFRHTSSRATSRATRGRRRTIAAALAVTVTAALLTAPAQPAQAAATTTGGRPHPQRIWRPREIPPPGSTAPIGTRQPSTTAAGSRVVSPAPSPITWPAAADTVLDVLPPAPVTTGHRAEEAAATPAVQITSRVRAAKPARVRLAVAGHTETVKAGIAGVLVSVSGVDGTTGPVDVAVNYGGFAQAYGGGFGDRLTLVEVPACVLSTPDVAGCHRMAPIAYANDRVHRQLTAKVSLPDGGQPMLLAATAGSTGVNGGYAATPLKASDSWSESGSTGSFSYSYPVKAPPSLGGPVPNLSVAYSSASVDGRTTVSNSQPSSLGEGWDLAGGGEFIETSYKPCSQVNTAWNTSGDMCLGTPNAVIGGGAHSGELVRDDSDTTKWRLSADDGTRVQLMYGTTGGSNNTNDQAYWKLTGTDGTVYLYGANRLPAAFHGTGADAPTYSTWSEPVFGTGSGTACNDPTGSVAPTSCRRAWRWNLDFVIDPHGNVTRYGYAREEDFYQHKTAVTEFTRSGFLTEIDYGWQTCDIVGSGCPGGRAVSTKPASVIQLDYAPRCLAGVSGCPTAPITVSTGIATTGITSANASAFPDVPYDQHCDATSTTCTTYSPSFYATVRLTGVRTSVNTGATPRTAQPTGTPAGYAAVDSYLFPQAFPAPQDYTTGVSGNHPQLRLEEIDHTGYVTNSDGNTTATNAPPVRLGYRGDLPNRAAASSLYATAQFYRFRLVEVTDELGGDMHIAYGQPGGLGCGTTAPPATIANTTLCYPEYFTYQGTPTLDWFNKYVVTGVTLADSTRPSGYAYSADRTTAYTYLGTPAWHTNDSEQADPRYRTVDQFRGFARVQTISGAEGSGRDAKTLVSYFRGLDQDPTVAVNVTDSHGGSYRDDNALSGTAYEAQTFVSDTATSPISDVITVPVDPTTIVTAAHTRASGLPAQRAHFAQTAKKITYEQVSTSATPRRSETDYTYDNSLPAFTGSGTPGGNGRLTLTDDKGDGTAAVAELCTFTKYAVNAGTPDTAQWSAFPYVTVTSTVPGGGSCSPSSATSTTTVSQTQTIYDGQTPGVLTLGDVTTTEAAPSFNGTWVVRSRAGGHDAYGRQGWSADALGNITSTTYSPASGLLPTTVATTNPKGWKSSVTVDRGRGVALYALDVNGRRVDTVYDGLGRQLKAWGPDRPMAAFPNSPSAQFEYGLYGAALGASGTLNNSYTRTQTLRDNGSYAQAYSILDGFGDPVETQSTPADGSAGLVSTQAEYDSLGRPWRTAAAHYDNGAAPSGTFRNYGDALPSQTATTYDGLSRALTVTQYSLAAAVPGMVTTTAYPGVERTDVTPPTGGTATSVVTDVRGRAVERWTYRTATATGLRADADVTSYGFAYTGTGTKTTVTDATGATTWTTSTGDLLGRTVSRVDPDSGTTATVLDDLGRVKQTTDARGQVISYAYDELGRKTAAYNAAWSATPDAARQVASWAYDTAPASDGKTTLGLPVSSTRIAGSAQYINATTGYDAGGRSLGTSVTIPGTEGSLAGTYTSTNHYTATAGLLDSTDLPAAGGLPAETVYNSYNVNGLLLATGGAGDYVADTQYDPYGRILSRTLGDYPYQFVRQNLYDPATGRLTNVFADAAAGPNAANPAQLNKYSVDYATFAYNAAGLLTSVAHLQNYTVSGSYNPGAYVRDVQCYAYDYANRLVGAWSDTGDQTPSATTNLDSPTTQPGGIGRCVDTTPAGHVGGPAPYWQSYAYSGTDAASGNRSTVIDHDTTGNTAKDVTRTSAYAPPGTANTGNGTGPHLLSKVTSTGGVAATDDYTYDASGNTLTRKVTSGAAPAANQTLTWDAEGHLASVTDLVSGKTAAFVYDASGQTLLRRDYATGTTNGTVTLYLGGTELHLSSGTVTGTRYYAYPSAPTIVADSTGKLSYELADQQGTGGTTLNAADGHVTARRYFQPFGDPRGTKPAWVDDHTFLGKSTDAATGLTTVGARTYDTSIGRFLSADPLFQSDEPQLMGGYAYAGSDPASLTDPSGLDPSNKINSAGFCVANEGVWSNGHCDWGGPSQPASPDGCNHNIPQQYGGCGPDVPTPTTKTTSPSGAVITESSTTTSTTITSVVSTDRTNTAITTTTVTHTDVIVRLAPCVLDQTCHLDLLDAWPPGNPLTAFNTLGSGYLLGSNNTVKWDPLPSVGTPYAYIRHVTTTTSTTVYVRNRPTRTPKQKAHDDAINSRLSVGGQVCFILCVGYSRSFDGHNSLTFGAGFSVGAWTTAGVTAATAPATDQDPISLSGCAYLGVGGCVNAGTTNGATGAYGSVTGGFGVGLSLGPQISLTS